MARRMISSDVVESDVFCSLTPSAQVLYIHLIMNADDDGFVDKWKSILRYLSIRRSRLDDLISTGHVILLDDDLLLIADWPRHNKIRLDRYRTGRYRDRLNTLSLQPNGRYIKASEDFLTP